LGKFASQAESTDSIQSFYPGEINMAFPIERETTSLGNAEKRLWTVPVFHTIRLNLALGSKSGSLCDKFGSLSASQGNDRCTPPKP